ncbi:universal stress protein [Pseudodesulfovibrio cashew]|uniref:Universal stress protein n=1 Tax=Pseudodesulfovibrio cashew TaxID=2678688 RepID=A0A6I6JH80_9BACT|nr:universal stress protein [Pseudodesulfovibrio cashew]QGY39437.1 universal stress protein [Pseudodesulfovibrio cashew]
MNVSKILLPVDGSPHSDAAAGMAIELAQDNNASVVLLHVRKAVPTGLGQPNADELLKLLTDGAEAVIEHYQARLEDAKVDHIDLIVGGNVGEVVANVARVEKCDLIVMGSKGKSDLEGLILGSATHKVLHTTELPVLVVK